MWATSNVNVEIVKNAAIAPYPLIPSAILTVTQQSGIMSGTGISPLDTANMLAPYLRKTDTTSLSLRIDQRVRYSDTASMLTPYLRKTDTASLSTRIINSGQSLTTLYRRLGSTTKAIAPHGLNLNNITANTTMSDGVTVFHTFYLDRADTLKGVRWFQRTQGVYTGDNYNGFGLYTMSGGTLTLVDSTTNDANIWKASTNTWTSKDFVTPYAASEGFYVIAYLYNVSGSASTAPSLGGSTAVLNGAVQSFDFGNGYSMSYNRPTSSASLITSVVASNLSYITPITYIAIY
jgi:hypothetical protein